MMIASRPFVGRRWLAVLVVVAGLVGTGTPALAQTPPPAPTPAPLSAKAVLIAPKTFTPGMPIALQAGESIGSDFRWELTNPSQFLMIADGRKQAATWTAPNSTEPFAVEFVAVVIDPKTGVVTSFDTQVAILLPEAAVDPKPNPKPDPKPKPTPTPKPVPVAKAAKLALVFIDQNTDRPKYLPYTKMITDLAFLQSLEAAGHKVYPVDADNAEAANYAKYTAAGLPALVVLNADKINATGAAPVLKSETLPATVDKAYVQKLVDTLTGKK